MQNKQSLTFERLSLLLREIKMQNKHSLTFERLSKTYLENNVSDSVIQDIILFAYFLKTLNPSQKTHYHLLDGWSNQVYSYLQSPP